MTSSVATAPTVTRIRWIDQLRGFALFLMILDHVLLIANPTDPLRSTLTRLSLPIFALLVGSMWRPGIRERHWQLVRAAAAATVVGPLIGVGQPDILLLLLLSIVVMHLRVDPIWLVILGFLQAWNLPIGWSGYEPGYVIAWVALGRIVPSLRPLHVAATSGTGFGFIGRYPLSIYVGHLVVLAAFHVPLSRLLSG